MHEITLFSIRQQTAQECDPWENERKGDETSNFLSCLLTLLRSQRRETKQSTDHVTS